MSAAMMAGRALLQDEAAAEAAAAAPDTAAVNTSFLLMSAYLVFFMQAGFAMVSSPFRLSKPLSPRPRWPCCVRSDELTEPSPPPSLSTPPPDPPRAWPRSSAPAVCGAKTP